MPVLKTICFWYKVILSVAAAMLTLIKYKMFNCTDLKTYGCTMVKPLHTQLKKGTAVAQWLRCCATNRKVAGSIPDGVVGICH